jgi:hypothetical protein
MSSVDRGYKNKYRTGLLSLGFSRFDVGVLAPSRNHGYKIAAKMTDEYFNQYFYKEALPRTILLNKPSVYPIDEGGPTSLELKQGKPSLHTSADYSSVVHDSSEVGHVFVVSARTNKRHHHHPLDFRTD